MKKSFLGLFAIAASCVAGWLSAAPELYRYTTVDWFGVSFTNCVVGTPLAVDTGIDYVDGFRSGSWYLLPDSGSAIIAGRGDEKFLAFGSSGDLGAGPSFIARTEASTASQDGYRIDCTAAFPLIEGLPSLPTGAKTAMCLACVDGATNFYASCKRGWVRLFSPGMVIDPKARYGQRATFVSLDGRSYVTYSIKVGGDYVELKDDEGVSRLEIASPDAVKTVEFRGESEVFDLRGVKNQAIDDPTDPGHRGWPLIPGSWFSVLMQDAANGALLAPYTGVQMIGSEYSGMWNVPESGAYEDFNAEVRETDRMRYLCVMPDDRKAVGPMFTAHRAAERTIAQVAFSMRFFSGDNALTATLPTGTKAAMTMTDVAGFPTFYGYTRDGWKELFADGVEAKYLSWYEMLATFEQTKDSLLVGYSVRTANGYVPFSDLAGKTQFEVSGVITQAVQNVEVLGDADVKFLNGTEMATDPKLAYYWIGGNYDKWSDSRNWSHTPDGSPCAEGDLPGPTASVILNADAAIKLDTMMEISNLVVSANITIEGETTVESSYGTDGKVNGLNGDQLVFQGIYGSGTLTIRQIVLRTAADNAVVECDLAVDSETSGLYCGDGQAMQIRGAVAGDGNLIAFQEGDDTGVTFGGNNEGYEATYTETVMNDHDCGRTRLASGDSSFPNARLDLLRSASNTPDSVEAPFGTSGDRYEFGAYNGHLISAQSVPVVIIGSLNEDCAIDGQVACRPIDENHYWSTTLIKVGTGTLTADVSELGAAEIWSGTLNFTSPKPMMENPKQSISFFGGTLKCSPAFDPSAYIRQSSSPIVFDDEGADHEWADSLGESNSGGIVKRGGGTLFLQSIPHYSGPTVIEKGRIVFPFGTSLGEVVVEEGCRLLVDLAGVTPDDGLLFYAASTNWLPARATDLFINIPGGFEIPEPIFLPDGGVLYAQGTHIYTWTGNNRSSDGLYRWSSRGNWADQSGATPPRAPDKGDFVQIPKNKPQVTVDVPAEVWRLSCEEGVPPFNFTTPAMSNDTYAVDNTSVLRMGSGVIPGMTGVGGLSVPEPLVVSVATNEIQSFVGSVTAPMLTKRGEGELVVAGVGSIGSLKIEGGTFKVGTHRDINGIRMDFDADPEYLSKNDSGMIQQWKSSVGNSTLEYAAGAYARPSTAYFGGRSTVYLRPDGAGAYSRYELRPTNFDVQETSKSLFILYHAVAVGDNDYLYADTTASTNSMRIRGAKGSHYWFRPVDVDGEVGFFTGTQYGSKLIANGSDYLTSWFNTPFAKAGIEGVTEALGTFEDGSGFCGAIGELVSYVRQLSHPERLAVQRSLMAKWGLEKEKYEVLSATTACSMNDGTTLDLGGLTQTVANFAGAGSVVNGELLTVDGRVVQTGLSLTIPAVAGTEYQLPGRKSELVLPNGARKVVTIVVPDDCSSSRVFFEGLVNWKKTNEAIEISGPDDEGWYTIVNGGGGSCIIIR